MAKFQYQARDSSGKIDTGVLTADGLDEAARLLRNEGKIIVSLEAESALAAAKPANSGSMRINRDEVIFFASQLAVMVETGVPLTEALDAVYDQTERPGMKTVLHDVCENVKAGTAFSDAMERYPKVFGNLFVSLIRVSEASGTMGMMLQQVSRYLRQERDTRKKIKGAMTYPLCMLSFCVLAVVSLLVFVLPRFEKIYAGKGATLPLPTRILLALSNGIMDHWLILVVGLAGTMVGGYLYFRSTSGRIFMDGLRIRLPLVGSMYRKAYLSRSLRAMATMISTGVSMLEGLAITSQVAGNHFFSKVWDDVADRVMEGSNLSDQLFECPLIPRTIAQMISAGERSGRLGTVMDRVAGFCEDDMNLAVKTMTNMIEPIMIVVMGLLIGGIAIALLLPIFSISKVIAH